MLSCCMTFFYAINLWAGPQLETRLPVFEVIIIQKTGYYFEKDGINFSKRQVYTPVFCACALSDW